MDSLSLADCVKDLIRFDFTSNTVDADDEHINDVEIKIKPDYEIMFNYESHVIFNDQRDIFVSEPSADSSELPISEKQDRNNDVISTYEVCEDSGNHSLHLVSENIGEENLCVKVEINEISTNEIKEESITVTSVDVNVGAENYDCLSNRTLRSEESFSCSCCNISFKSRRNFTKHGKLCKGSSSGLKKNGIFSVENSNGHNTGISTEKTRCPLLRSQQKDIVAKTLYPCNSCEAKFSLYHSLKRHMFIKHSTEKSKHSLVKCQQEDLAQKKPYQCNLCEVKCTRLQNLKRHILHKHATKKLNKHASQTVYACDMCEYETKQAVQLSAHKQRIHVSKPGQYACNLCNHKSDTYCLLEQHKRDRHMNKKIYACDLCEFKTAVPVKLKSHKMWKHSDITSYACNLCSFKCIVPSELKLHKLKHNTEKSYSCNFCEYTGTALRNLYRHMRRQHLYACACDLCDYKSGSSLQLQRHRKYQHHTEVLHKCDMCDYTSNSFVLVKKHKTLKHLSEQKFVSSNLNQHKKLHSEDTCDLCDYICTDIDNMRRHKLVKHFDEKRYACDQCEYRSKISGHVKRHKRAKHPDKKQY